MKLRSLISAVVLCMAVFVQAQTSPAPQAPGPALKVTGVGGSGAATGGKPVAGYVDLENRMETLILKAGPLTEVVVQVERQVKENPKQPNGFLPNLVYAKDIRDAVVPGDLTLRGVTPVQALALVAAAAGCTFQPIMAPDEKAGQEKRIIGYRIVPQAASGSDGASARRSMITPPGSQFGSSGSPFGSSGGSSGPSAFTGGLLPKVQVVELNASRGMSSGNDLNRVPKNSFPDPAATPVENNRPIVRIYALGSILTGSVEEIGEKQNRFQELVDMAVGKSEPDADLLYVDGASSKTAGTPKVRVRVDPVQRAVNPKTRPELSFHYETKALVVRATAAQHEIIEQAVQALKENVTDTDIVLGHRQNLIIEQSAQALKAKETQTAAPAKP